MCWEDVFFKFQLLGSVCLHDRVAMARVLLEAPFPVDFFGDTRATLDHYLSLATTCQSPTTEMEYKQRDRRIPRPLRLLE